jgi:hypothetical protein
MSLATLPAHPYARAYVLKLAQDCRPDDGIWRGRIEHLASGAQCDFGSAEELLGGLIRMTSTQRPGPTPDATLVSINHPEELK